MQVPGATEQEPFNMLVAIGWATSEDIDRIFPLVTTDCQICQKKNCPCRFLSGAFTKNPDVYACLECFHAGQQASVAAMFGDKQSFEAWKEIFLALEKTFPGLEN